MPLRNRVDDIVPLWTHPNIPKKLTVIPEVLQANREMKLFFETNNWVAYTMHSEEHNISDICVDAKQFIENYIIAKPRNVSIKNCL